MDLRNINPSKSPCIINLASFPNQNQPTDSADEASNEGDSTGGLIPYKNPHALIAYYLGLFSLFPYLGLLLAIPAFILGIMGLQKVKKNPAIRGTVHAWIGIVMGGLMTVVWSAAIVFALLAAAFAK